LLRRPNGAPPDSPPPLRPGGLPPPEREVESLTRLDENGRLEEPDSCSSLSSSSSSFLRNKLILASYHNLLICATG
jgi:hypothetical protein